jgi:hypothetical protein
MCSRESLRRAVIRCVAIYGIEPDVLRQLPHLQLMQLARSIMAITVHKRRIAELTHGVQGSRRYDRQQSAGAPGQDRHTAERAGCDRPEGRRVRCFRWIRRDVFRGLAACRRLCRLRSEAAVGRPANVLRRQHSRAACGRPVEVLHLRLRLLWLTLGFRSSSLPIGAA